jgi:hypothetical protein
MTLITYDEFEKVEIRLGQVIKSQFPTIKAVIIHLQLQFKFLKQVR